MSNPKKFIQLPGTRKESDRLISLLRASSDEDHILIRGPRGCGKSYFLNIIKNWVPKLGTNKVQHHNCASFSPELVDSELFGHVKGAFTGASSEKKGLIENAENDGFIILEEINSLSLPIQAKLLVYMDRFEYRPVGGNRSKKNAAKVRVIATSNFEEGTALRPDLYDRFKVVVDIPPLYKRRRDVLFFIGKKYSELEISNTNLLLLYAHNWPGNLRELDKAMWELATTGTLPESIAGYSQEQNLCSILESVLKSGIPASDFNVTCEMLFRGIVPCFSSFINVETRIIEQYTMDPVKVRVTIDVKNDIQIYRPTSQGDRKINDRETVSYFFEFFFGGLSVYSEASILELPPHPKESLDDEYFFHKNQNDRKIISDHYLPNIQYHDNSFVEKVIEVHSHNEQPYVKTYDKKNQELDSSGIEKSKGAISRATIEEKDRLSHDFNCDVAIDLLNHFFKTCRTVQKSKILPGQHETLDIVSVANYLLAEKGRFLSILREILNRPGKGWDAKIEQNLEIKKGTLSRWKKQHGWLR
ncbi:MAG: sigma 54-interacting transcriptional regulator [Desulforhopalus sp.]